MMASAELETSFLCGGGLLRHPLLVDDGKTLIAAQGSRLSVHSAATAETQYSLLHSSPISAMVLHPHSSTQVFVGCEDGSLVLWDLVTARRVQAWNLGITLESLAVCNDAAYVTCGWREQEAGRVLAYDLKTATFKDGRAKLSAARPLVASACGDLLATVDRHSVLIWQVASFPQKPLVLTHTKPVVCVALSHSGDAVAAGDTTGRILLWRGILQVINAGDCNAINLLPSTAHWHAGPVRCVAFTSDGAFLLSGGHEGVLVVWNVASGQRTYLPRLGACLRDIRVCGDSASAVVCTDSNVMHVVDLGALVVRCSLHGLYAPRAANMQKCLATHPRTGLLMVPRAETIQFFDLQRNLHVASLELTKGIAGCQSPVASPQAVPLNLTHAMFDATGELLVTVEQGSAFSSNSTSVLKIWKCLEQPSNITSFARPCGGPFWFEDSVTSVAVHPCGQLVAVACGQGGVRVLQLGGTSGTVAHTDVGSLASGKILPGFLAEVLKFSPDGSILGVAGACSLPIFLVDPLKQTHAALAPVGWDSSCGSVRQLCFSADSSHLIVVWDDGCADVSLLSQAVNWVCHLPAVSTAVDPCHSRVALTTTEGTVALLDWRGPAPVGVGLTHNAGEHSQTEFGASQATFTVATRPVKEVPTGVLVLNCAQDVAADPACLPLSATTAGALLYGRKAPPSKAAGPPHHGALGWNAHSDGHAAMALLPSGSHVLTAAADLCPSLLEELLATPA